jgi:hypothetical protein
MTRRCKEKESWSFLATDLTVIPYRRRPEYGSVATRNNQPKRVRGSTRDTAGPKHVVLQGLRFAPSVVDGGRLQPSIASDAASL